MPHHPDLWPNHPTRRFRFGYVVYADSWHMTEHPGDEGGRCPPGAVAPPLTLAILLGPLVFGLAGTALPAFGYLPELGGEHFTTEHFSALGEQPGIARSALLSILVGLVTTLISLGTVAAFVASDLGTATFSRVRRLISPLLSVPHAAAAFGLAFMIAPSGMIMRLISPWATGLDRPPDLLIVNDPMALSMMAGLIVKEIPFLFLVTLAALPQTRHSETMRLGRSLGYGRIASFTFLLWPPLYRQIRLAVFAVVAYATSVVDVALILGPHLPPTLPVRLIDWMNDPDLETRFLASAGAVMQLGVTLAALLIWVVIERIGAMAVCLVRDRGARMRRDLIIRKDPGTGHDVELGTCGVWRNRDPGALVCFRAVAIPDALPANFSYAIMDAGHAKDERAACDHAGRGRSVDADRPGADHPVPGTRI
jgi:ABC-type uncharacterized transport system YnjBCD permease subunit